MKSIQLFICASLISLGFNSCEKDKAKAIQEIGYGTSFGMCVGYCFNDISISANKITFTKSKNGNMPETKTCTKAIIESEVAALKELVDTSEFVKLPEVIGCPDCADGGAEWISLRLDGKIKTVKFEYGKAPNELRMLAQKLKEIKDGFADCN